MAIQEEIQIQLTNQLKSAYRKYKSFVYYDSYSQIQKIELSNFERNPKIIDKEFEIEEFFQILAKIISDEKTFDEMTDLICDEIDVIAYPKHAVESEQNKKVIRNFNFENLNMDKLHFFIDLPIVGQILGVLWILRCGYLLDDKLYSNCYGNRLNKHLLENLKDRKSEYYDNDCSDFTPFLFIPYFKNYQSWRDNALGSVENLLDNKKNAIMISLDLKEYFHRSLIDFKGLNRDINDTRDYINKVCNDSIEISDEDIKIDNSLTKFIEKVFYRYSDKFNRKFTTKTFNNRKIDTEKYPMIPVGFTPSLLISNWNLQGFDQAIIENVRPQYYGRYVDDILIVLGSHEKSESYGLQQIEENSLDELIEKYLTDDSHPKTHIFKKDARWNSEKIYRIHNQSFNNSNNHKITYHYEGLEIQDDKLKTFFFSNNHSNAIIENFKNEIKKNSTEFKVMHDFESIKQDFKESLYKINYKESINKIRDIETVEANKFEISKMLSLINWNTVDTSDKIDNELINNLFDAIWGNIFDYLTLWDRIFSMLLVNDKYKQLKELIIHIQKNIQDLTFNPVEGNSYEFNIKEENDIDVVKYSLMRCLYDVLSRVFSLKYDSDVKSIIEDIEERFIFEIDFASQISNCLYSSMQYNSLMKEPLADLSPIYDNIDNIISFDLTKQSYGPSDLFKSYCYPRFIKLHECFLHVINNDMFGEDKEKNNVKKLFSDLDDDEIQELLKVMTLMNETYVDKSFKIYQDKNFGNDDNLYEDYVKNDCDLKCSEDSHCPLKIYDETQFKDLNVVKIKGNQKNSLKIGLLNTNVDYTNFESRILGKPNLSSKRFDGIKILINEAIQKNVDLLVMPEMYIPYDWIEKIVRVSKDHHMAIVFGIEPIEYKYEIGSYIVMTLPFIYDGKYDECALMVRPVNHYSPEQIMQFEKYEKRIKDEYDSISKYYMCIWEDIHIVPYGSYEIANIEDRGVFKSCCDLIIVSEFNQDAEYTNNILESLSRDLFCYCIKSNSSKYGGSVIIQPTSYDDKYLINLKGGQDDYIATQDLDIKKLRENAILSDKIVNSSGFEAKPPRFWKNNVKKRY